MGSGTASAPDAPAPKGRNLVDLWTARGVAALLGCMAVGAALVAADRAFGLGLFPDGGAVQLGAAARAVLPEPDDRGPVDYARALGPDGQAVVAPVGVKFSRVAAVGLTVEVDEKRLECEETIARLLALDHLGADEEEVQAEAQRAAKAWRAGEAAIGKLLAMEPDRARLCLAALGWPWLGDDARGLLPENLSHMYPFRPGALSSMKSARWRAILADADLRVAWPKVRADLAVRYDLDDAQLRALKAYIVRRDVARAFHSSKAARQARETLARLVDMAPSQARTFQAMAGARELMNAGTPAFPALIDLLEQRPDLALPLLYGCVRRSGVRRQALRVADAWISDGRADAEQTLVALGPFGAEAVDALRREAAARAGVRDKERMDQRAEAVLKRIRQDWPEADSALRALGDDPVLWRRWYRTARRVL